jgi:hypothetical protein
MSGWNSTLRSSGPLPRRSKKRTQLDHQFARVREFAMERDGGCQLARRLNGSIRQAGDYGHRCEGPLDPHHVVPVARDSTLRLDLNNLVVLCRLAHSWVHEHPAEATELGLLKSVGPAQEQPQ